MINVKQFINNFKYKPVGKIRELNECYGMVVLEFRKKGKIVSSLEIYKDDVVYFEMLDFTNYIEGSIIPLHNSPIRYNTRYCNTHDRRELCDFISHVNNCLKELYKRKQ